MLAELLKPFHSKEKTQVLEAINTLRFKVTPENIALTTSLPVATAAQQLNIIAAETSAHLKVDSAGALLYEFSPGFERAYIYDVTKQLFTANGNIVLRLLRVAVRLAIGLTVAAIKIVLLVLNFLFRAMFGILLIGSIIAIVVGIFAAIAGLFDGDGPSIDIGDVGGGDILSGIGNVDWHFDFGYFTYDFVRLLSWSYYWSDPCYYHSYGYSYDYYYSPQTANSRALVNDQEVRADSTQKGDFVTNCFSYLFGDGHPNADLQERYWHQIGLVIKRNHGVVVAEQLAPFVGDQSGTEDWMLPILVHFNGSPEVTDKGNILYVFPSFVREDNLTAQPLSLKPQQGMGGGDQLRDLYRSHLKRQADQSWGGPAVNAQNQLARSLEERRWEFSLQGVESSTKIAGITILNFIGSYWLYTASAHTKLLLSFHQMSMYMLGYATFLLVFPAARFFWITCLNIGIDKRNEQRSKLASALSAPTSELKEKLSEASAHINQLLLAPAPSIVFTTEEDSLEQQFKSTPAESSTIKFNASRNYISKP